MKKLASLFAILIAASLAFCLSGCSDTTDFDFGSDDGSTNMTVLIYMIGSDLESDGGAATNDLKEMCSADLGDRVNVVIEAGGAKKWHNSKMTNKQVTRAIIKNGKIKVQDNLGKVNMVKPKTLSDFITWGTKTYPADRYALILWDHGGGTQMGFGQDEIAGTDDLLSLGEISSALKTANKHFDFIGFDACLMGTIETAAVCSPYADYLIASEETEGADGWYYSNWLDKLGSNPGVDTKTLGSCIVDQYVNGPDTSFFNYADLSLIDLKAADSAYTKLRSYLATSDKLISSKTSGYKQLATARSSVRSFGEDQFDQVDLIGYMEEAGVDGSQEVISAIKEAVVYQDSNYDGANGLAIFFPYSWPSYYEDTLSSLKQAGIGGSEYQGFFSDFLTLTVVGQKKNGGTDSIFYLLTESKENYSKTSWYNKKLAGGVTEKEVETVEVPKNDKYLPLVEKNGEWYLQLSDSEWDTVTQILTDVYVESSKGGYYDLGCDNFYEFDNAGDLHITYDYLWVSINDQIVPFYIVESENGKNWYDLGYSPALLNGKENIEVLIYRDKDHEYGTVIGYRNASQSEDHSVFNRENLQFEEGDYIEFVFDRYKKKGEYIDSVVINKGITFHENQGLTVSLSELDSKYRTHVTVRLKDIYNNEFWTDFVEF